MICLSTAEYVIPQHLAYSGGFETFSKKHTAFGGLYTKLSKKQKSDNLRCVCDM
jgi:hypothetical protein